jgi:hypothetical protein
LGGMIYCLRFLSKTALCDDLAAVCLLIAQRTIYVPPNR